jgi:Arc/MetJ-type ribon-helix-helix transcriptional regulator
MPKIHRLPDTHSDTEKVTINLGHVDLGRIDLLVREGFYSNRTDFIRSAIRNRLTAESKAVDQSIERHRFELGLFDVSREELERIRDEGEVLHLRVLGLARIAQDVPAELARQTIGSLSVLGSFHASKDVKAALKDRIT